ncbi:MAG: hypothetical protein AB8B48_19110 [Pseudomonadales bacterium]
MEANTKPDAMKPQPLMLRTKYSAAMKVQALYALMCIVWNAVVIFQMHAGFQPIGPTGSTVVITGAVILVALLAYSLHSGWELAYVLLAAVVSLLALSAVFSSMTNSSDAWPSEFWQVAGLLINVIGALSFLVVITLLIRGRRAL